MTSILPSALWQLSIAMCLLLLSASVGGDWRATENVNWTPRRLHMEQLRAAAAQLRLTLSPDLESTWTVYSAEQRRLFDLAIRFDAEEQAIRTRGTSAAEWAEFNQRCEVQYNQYVRQWEQALQQTLTTLQEQERQRLKAAAANAGASAPRFEPPTPVIQPDTPPRFVQQVSALRNHILNTKPADIAAEVVPMAADMVSYSVSAPAAVSIQVAIANYRALGGAMRAEDARLAQDMSRLRQLPGVLSKIQAENRLLEQDVASGRITREEKRRRLGELARGLVDKLPSAAAGGENRLVENLFSREAGYEFLSSLGSWAVNLATAKATEAASARYMKAFDSPLDSGHAFFEGDAHDAAEYARLKRRLVAEQIARHSYDKHVLKTGPSNSADELIARIGGDQWPEVRTIEQLTSEVETILNKTNIPHKHVGGGKILYWDTATDTIVWRDPAVKADGGTIFRPAPGTASVYYNDPKWKEQPLPRAR